MIQQIINLCNIESGNDLVDNNNINKASGTLKILIPFIQFFLNQKKSRFTNISPTILMFGKQLNELLDLP